MNSSATGGETVLLTGASGVVGTALLPRLAGHRVVALVHRRTPVGALATVRGDMCQPLLGLAPEVYGELQDTVSVVVHCAATTDVGRGQVDHDRVNVGGTEEVLRFAAAAGARLVYVSTAYVCEGISEVAVASRYEASKRMAEARVRESGVPAVVVRPSIVLGDSHSGEISEEQGLHLVVTGIVLGRVPVVPGESATYVDFVPQDHLASVVRRLVDLPAGQWPSEVWVTQGSAAMCTGEVVETSNRFAARQGLTHKPARCVPHDTIERLFLPVFLPALPARLQKEFCSLLRLARYMNVHRHLPDATPVAGELGPDTVPAPLPVLERNLQAWWRRSGSTLARRAG
jgi:nucleoside-diphosphate-sugar epimerase